MLNSGKLKENENATRINLPNSNYIFVYAESIQTGIISVRNTTGECLWQKVDCTAVDIPFAIEIGMRNIQTNVFETD